MSRVTAWPPSRRAPRHPRAPRVPGASRSDSDPGDRRTRRADAGIALPVSLLALIAVSVLVTTVILTGTNESLLSLAHQDATTGLYMAEGGVQAYLADKGAALAPVQWESYTPPGATAPVLVSVELLARLDPAGAGPDTAWLYAVHATQPGDGRAVAVLAHVRNTRIALVDGVEAAVTVGGRLGVRGYGRLSDGSDADGACPLEPAAWAALRADGAPGVDWRDHAAALRVGAEGELAEVGPDALLEHLLGAGLHTLGGSAAIRFGPRYGAPPFGEAQGTGNRVGTPTSVDPRAAYNWGCPEGMTSGCAAGDAQHRPRVAIDASAGSAPGTVTLRGGHGQGILVVTGGNLRLTQGFRFRGLVVVEGALLIPDADATDPVEIEGAVVVLGGGAGAPASEIGGSSLVRFSRCAVRTVIDDFNADDIHRAALIGGTLGWVEVVR